MLTFMDTESYEQIELPADLLGDRRPFLQDGMTAQIEYYESEALSVSLPQKVTCTVTETEPVVKGQTASKSFKPALLDNGFRIMVPPFINVDEAIIVDTESTRVQPLDAGDVHSDLLGVGAALVEHMHPAGFTKLVTCDHRAKLVEPQMILALLDHQIINATRHGAGVFATAQRAVAFAQAAQPIHHLKRDPHSTAMA